VQLRSAFETVFSEFDTIWSMLYSNPKSLWFAVALALFSSACADEGAVPDPISDAQPADAIRLITDDGIIADAAPDAAPMPDAQPIPMEPDMGPVDAGAQGPAVLAPQNEWGPLARVTRIELPESLEHARQSGCLVLGDDAGSALHGFIALTGASLPDMVRPDADGRIPLVFLMQAGGWEAGVPVFDLAEIDLRLMTGGQAPDGGLLMDVDGVGNGIPPHTFEQTIVDNGWLDTAPGDLDQPIRVPEGPLFSISLEYTRVDGHLRVDGAGFGVDHGIITGYVTRPGIIAMIGELKALCVSENAPSVCGIVAGELDRPNEELEGILVALVGGYDVHFGEDAFPTPCDEDPETCDAIGVCLLYEAEGARVEGVFEGP
jgi:hypothetical protein